MTITSSERTKTNKPAVASSRLRSAFTRESYRSQCLNWCNQAFRHSAATIVNQKTGNLKLVQKLLGHSNLSTTADVYTHTSAHADRSAALALEQAIYGDLFQVVPRFETWNNNAALNYELHAPGSACNLNYQKSLQDGTAQGLVAGGGFESLPRIDNM